MLVVSAPQQIGETFTWAPVRGKAKTRASHLGEGGWPFVAYGLAYFGNALLALTGMLQDWRSYRKREQYVRSAY
jgi:hypothetical protein